MKYRKLRIAWSVAWGVLAVLLCVLWVRSYWRSDITFLYNSPIRCFYIGSELGVMGIVEDARQQQPQMHYRYWSEPINDDYAKTVRDRRRGLFLDFGSLSMAINTRALMCPHWFLATAATVIAALPWLPFRFSLRALLIAMTLVAVGLGVVVWMS